MCWWVHAAFDIACRLPYAVYLVEELVKRHDKTQLYITYDIACMLQRHLKVSIVVYSSSFNICCAVLLALWSYGSIRENIALSSNISLLWSQSFLSGKCVHCYRGAYIHV